jgi:CMP-N-acetylneuraminic acid synthetase
MTIICTICARGGSKGLSNKALRKKVKLLNKKTSLFIMPRNRSIDIDDIYDLNLVKLLIKDDKKLFR